ncbi:hypothetical protein BB561_006626 [Smittium simulii]|uniref:Mediator of RNA polymerase II transcription subunit 7 n=1 Tax=Smittium simulii TaxID=133385 RepID=A0A2T9Y2Z6_9FUNG|nr:hypothetical protein BB561_006626 [Smittium simulii]
MADKQKNSTAFPPPPQQYKKFTSEALASFRQEGQVCSTDEQYEYFVPPVPPKGEEYEIFGQAVKLCNKALSGIEQLDTVPPTQQQLRELVLRVVIEYLRLVKTLSENPVTVKIQGPHRKTAAYVFRVDKAKETLKLVVKKQSELMETKNAELIEARQEIRRELEQEKNRVLAEAKMLVAELDGECAAGRGSDEKFGEFMDIPNIVEPMKDELEDGWNKLLQL